MPPEHSDQVGLCLHCFVCVPTLLLFEAPRSDLFKMVIHTVLLLSFCLILIYPAYNSVFVITYALYDNPKDCDTEAIMAVAFLKKKKKKSPGGCSVKIS